MSKWLSLRDLQGLQKSGIFLCDRVALPQGRAGAFLGPLGNLDGFNNPVLMRQTGVNFTVKFTVS